MAEPILGERDDCSYALTAQEDGLTILMRFNPGEPLEARVKRLTEALEGFPVQLDFTYVYAHQQDLIDTGYLDLRLRAPVSEEVVERVLAHVGLSNPGLSRCCDWCLERPGGLRPSLERLCADCDPVFRFSGHMLRGVGESFLWPYERTTLPFTKSSAYERRLEELDFIARTEVQPTGALGRVGMALSYGVMRCLRPFVRPQPLERVDRPEDLAIRRERWPRLYSWLDSLALATGVPPPEEVVVDNSLSLVAWTEPAAKPRAGPRVEPGRRRLKFGHLWLDLLEREEMAVLLCRELAHWKSGFGLACRLQHELVSRPEYATRGATAEALAELRHADRRVCREIAREWGAERLARASVRAEWLRRMIQTELIRLNLREVENETMSQSFLAGLAELPRALKARLFEQTVRATHGLRLPPGELCAYLGVPVPDLVDGPISPREPARAACEDMGALQRQAWGPQAGAGRAKLLAHRHAVRRHAEQLEANLARWRRPVYPTFQAAALRLLAFDYARAAELYSQVLEWQPDHHQARQECALALIGAGQEPARALAVLDVARCDDDVHLERVAHYFWFHHVFELVLPVYRRLRELRPESAIIRDDLARLERMVKVLGVRL